MYFPVKGRALINIPKVFLNAHLLRWVTKYKYLGIILTDDLSDDCNMLRQRGMFVANGVMSFNELWRKSLYNFKQRVTKSNNFIVNHVYNFTRATSKIWKNSDNILYIL